MAPSPQAVCVKRRCLDLIQTWISGYFCIDFLANDELAASMYSFIQEHVSSFRGGRGIWEEKKTVGD